MIAESLHQAEELCRAVASLDLEGVPLYIVPQSILPPECGSADYAYGYTCGSLDLYIRDHIPGYCGRGPCMVLNDMALGQMFEPEDVAYLLQIHALHELAHVLDRPALYDDRTGVDPNKLLFETLVVADVTQRPQREDIPPYHGHEAGFIRIALHLCHRAAVAGFDVRPGAICAGYRYGLSPAACYLESLGDEPARCAEMLFRDIAETTPPQAFSSLWCDDYIKHHNLSPVPKGSAP